MSPNILLEQKLIQNYVLQRIAINIRKLSRWTRHNRVLRNRVTREEVQHCTTCTLRAGIKGHVLFTE